MHYLALTGVELHAPSEFLFWRMSRSGRIKVILSVHYLLNLLNLLAFDVVDHSILIRKLSMYKFEEQSLLWFISYLKKPPTSSH